MVSKAIVFDPYLFPHDPNTWYIEKNLLSEEECDKLIVVGDTYPTVHSTMGYDEEEGSVTEHSHRDSYVTWIPQDLDVPVINHMWQTFHDAVIAVNKKMWGFDLRYMWEQAQYTKYVKGGHFGYHMDLGKGTMCVRKVSAIILLSSPDDCEGGELQFYNDKTVTVEKGDAVFFPSYLLHRVTPVTQGTRCSVVLWSGGAYYK